MYLFWWRHILRMKKRSMEILWSHESASFHLFNMSISGQMWQGKGNWFYSFINAILLFVVFSITICVGSHCKMQLYGYESKFICCAKKGTNLAINVNNNNSFHFNPFPRFPSFFSHLKFWTSIFISSFATWNISKTLS